MQLSVLQWNVWFRENIEHVLDVLRQHSADVICMQELTRGYIEQTHENTWEYIAHELGYEYRVQEIPIVTPTGQWAQANAILSRFPIRHKSTQWIHEPDDPESTTDQYRGYLEVTVDVGDTELAVATTHMSFRTDPGDDRELRQLLANIEGKQTHFVLTGDLNATPQSPTVQALDQRLQHAGPNYRQNTWTTKPYHFGDVEMSTLDWRFDYIFTTPDVRTIESHIIKTDVSDHLPVVATLSLEP
jgi:endonuclease/exonuclease/phosphatase family metal-dependent hydrolase